MPMTSDFKSEFVEFVRTPVWHAKYVTSFSGLLEHSWSQKKKKK